VTLVSIVTPSLNQVSFLGQAMRSVLDQEYADVEYLVVDGGSSDGSVDLIRQHADRLAWWVSEPDAGQADAINKGFGHAGGEIVAWLNSDDYYLPGTIDAAVRALAANPEALFVYGDVRAVDAEDRLLNRLKYPQVSLQDLLCLTIIGQPAVFIRRSALVAAGGLDTRFDLLLDHQLWIRLAAAGPVRHINETWAAARSHAAAKNLAQARLFGAEAFRILEWAAADRALAPVLKSVSRRARASAHRVNARYLLDAGEPAASLRAWFRALSIHPGSALARLNIAAGAALELLGMGSLRRAVIQGRGERLQR
jgi:glycosyltransferase involved in cell wall biosynthesis